MKKNRQRAYVEPDESTRPRSQPHGWYKVWQLPSGKWGMVVHGSDGPYTWWDRREGKWSVESLTVEAEISRQEFHNTQDEATDAALAAWVLFGVRGQGALSERAAMPVKLLPHDSWS